MDKLHRDLLTRLGPIPLRKLHPAACFQCKHWKSGTQTCAAFPEKIPREIFLYGNSHTTPFPRDNGIRFELLPEKK